MYHPEYSIYAHTVAVSPSVHAGVHSLYAGLVATECPVSIECACSYGGAVVFASHVVMIFAQGAIFVWLAFELLVVLGFVVAWDFVVGAKTHRLEF